MKTFKDSASRTWTLAINVAAIKRVRSLLNIDLYRLVDDRMKGLGELLGDPVQLVDVLYVLCRDEAAAAGVSDEAFGQAMAGDVLELATDAFLAEFTDFFPDPRVRTGIKSVIEKSRRLRDRVTDHLETKIRDFDPDAAATKLIASFGSSPASSGSTRRRSRSGS